MLALAAKPQPLVNPAAFSFSRDAVWMTTSRHAMKLALARRDPRASFLVDDGRHCVLLEGELDVFDALDVPSQIRALLEGPGFYLSLARYAVKNAAFVGGYLRDLARIPGDWWPQNRAVLRLRARRAWSLPTVPTPPAEPASIPLVPASVRRTLAHVAVAYLCTLSDDAPLMAPALWAARRRRIPYVLAVFESGGLANRLFRRWAAAACVSFADDVERFPTARTVLTGYPLRPGFAPNPLSVPARRLLVIGGSQGARRINDLHGVLVLYLLRLLFR